MGFIFTAFLLISGCSPEESTRKESEKAAEDTASEIAEEVTEAMEETLDGGELIFGNEGNINEITVKTNSFTLDDRVIIERFSAETFGSTSLDIVVV
ncbi:hypothetical protein [Jeotgalibacillus soli]|uniref:Uncharacterized protein n=1 Tax=Jeotgalibacillus soli TaxID=889306 RepID=A0A0C2RVN0_9BACL|nr:hypothetical protein [Jeotgalibacillus soli]KIL45824.1 hypothetical protein KP78_21730 [Jeotgalibacillus soli]